MNFPASADSWLDVIDHALVILGAIVLAVIPVLLHRNGKQLTAVREQVVNQHSSNLRDDVDRAILAIETLSHDVRGLRHDLASEEDRRRQQINELRDDLARRRR